MKTELKRSRLSAKQDSESFGRTESRKELLQGLFQCNRSFSNSRGKIDSYLATKLDRAFEKAKGVAYLYLTGI